MRPPQPTGDHSFYTVESSGARAPVEFRKFEDGLAMLWGPARFNRTGSGR